MVFFLAFSERLLFVLNTPPRKNDTDLLRARSIWVCEYACLQACACVVVVVVGLLLD